MVYHSLLATGVARTVMSGQWNVLASTYFCSVTIMR